MRFKPNDAEFAYFAEAKKSLPYTVRLIGDASALKEWKNDQAIKQAEWEARKALRHASIVTQLQDGTITNKTFEESDTTKKWNRYFGKNTAVNNESEFYIPIQNNSIISKIYKWLTT